MVGPKEIQSPPWVVGNVQPQVKVYAKTRSTSPFTRSIGKRFFNGSNIIGSKHVLECCIILPNRHDSAL